MQYTIRMKAQMVPIDATAVITNAKTLAQLRASAGRACSLLKAMANEDRLLLLCQLAEKECNVGELQMNSGIVQPTLSQQLGVLRDEGLVSTRRDGKFIFYRLASAEAIAVMQALYASFCGASKSSVQAAKRRGARS